MFEIPSVVISVRTPTHIRDALDQLGPTTDKTQALQLVGALLHDFHPAHVAPGKSLHDRSEWLKPPMLDPAFRVFQSAKRLIIVHSERFDSDDYRHFAWGVFRTYCAARGTWHLYILFNEMLDESIAKIARDFQPLAIVDKERSVIAVTGYFLKNLAVEDPFVRAVGLTPLANLYYNCAVTFGLKELRQLIEFKLEKIDALYNMIFSYRVKLPYQRSHARSWVSLCLAIVFCVLAIASGVFFPGRLSPSFLPWVLAGTCAFLALACWLSWLLDR